MAFWDDFFNDSDSQKKVEKFTSRAEAIDISSKVQEPKKSPQEEKKITLEPERLDEIDILTKSIELAPKKLTIGFKPLISIRKLMAVREMFNLKAPKKVNKNNLAELLIKALKTV